MAVNLLGAWRVEERMLRLLPRGLSKLKDPTRSGRRDDDTMADSRRDVVPLLGGGALVEDDTGSSTAPGESVREVATPPAASSAADDDDDDRFFLDDMNVDLVLTLLSKFIVVVSTVSKAALSMKFLANMENLLNRDVFVDCLVLFLSISSSTVEVGFICLLCEVGEKWMNGMNRD